VGATAWGKARTMSFYIRKALRVGPLRFNLSRSGIGVSAGIKGLRIGTGPRGNYVHMGRGGLYFRKTLVPGQPAAGHRDQVPPAPRLPSPGLSDSVEMTEIESGTVLGMVDSTSAELVNELNTKRKRQRIWPFVVAGVAGLVALTAASGLPVWGLSLLLAAGTGLSVFAYFKDELRKTTVIFYELEPEAGTTYQHLHDAFDSLRGSAGLWQVGAQGAVRDAKYHAGASTLVRRQSIRPNKGPVPFLKTNVEVPTLSLGRQLLAFMPDRLLVFDAVGVGAVGYRDLNFEVRQTRFIEASSVPGDAKVVGYTWKYVNKKGGPDKRFKDNRQLPIALYDELRILSASGLNEMLQVSKQGVAETLANAAKALAREPAATPEGQATGPG